MSDFFVRDVNDNEVARMTGGQALPTTLGQTLKATFDDPLYRPTALAAQSSNLPEAAPEGVELLDTDTLNERYGGLGLKFDKPVSEDYASALAKGKLEERKRQDILERGPTGFMAGAARLGAGLAAAVTDPVNIAAGFIPVVSQARYAGMIARMGKTQAMIGKGFIEGALGNAALEPLVYGLSQQQQLDYTLADSAVNVLFGGILGGGIHLGAGKLSQYLESLKPSEGELLIRQALSDVVSGRQANVTPILNLLGHRIGPDNLPAEFRVIGTKQAAAKFADIATLEDLDVVTRGLRNSTFDEAEIARLQEVASSRRKDAVEAKLELESQETSRQIKDVFDTARRQIEEGADEASAVASAKNALKDIFRDVEAPEVRSPLPFTKEYLAKAAKEGTPEAHTVAEIAKGKSKAQLKARAEEDGIVVKAKDTKNTIAAKIAAHQELSRLEAEDADLAPLNTAEAFRAALDDDPKNLVTSDVEASTTADANIIGQDVADIDTYMAGMNEDIAAMRITSPDNLTPEQRAFLQEVDEVDDYSDTIYTAVTNVLSCILGK